MDEEFDIFDREVQPRLDRESLGDVDGRERGVEGEIEAVLVASLAVGQTGEMFSIAVEELDSEVRAVNPVYVLAREGQVGGEVNLAHLGLLVGIVVNGDDHANDALEADGVELRVMERDGGAPSSTVVVAKTPFLGLWTSTFPSNFFGRPGFFCFGPL